MAGNSKKKCPKAGNLYVEVRRQQKSNPKKWEKLAEACKLKLTGGDVDNPEDAIQNNTTFKNLCADSYTLELKPEGDEAGFDIEESIEQKGTSIQDWQPIGDGTQERPVQIEDDKTRMHYYRFYPSALRVLTVVEGTQDPIKGTVVTATSSTGTPKLADQTTNKSGLADFGLVPRSSEFTFKIKLTAEDAKKYVPEKEYGPGPAARLDEDPFKIEVAPINVVSPKLELEYKVVLLDANLAQYQENTEPEKFYADPTYIQVSYAQTNIKFPFTKGGKLKCTPANVDIFTDEECKTALAGDLAAGAPLSHDDLASPKKLYLKGKTAGKFEISLELDDPADATMTLDENPATASMGVVELKFKLHQYDPDELAALQVDPDTDLDTGYSNLKKAKIPDQKEFTDEDKVKSGRLLHVQQDGGFARAKLICSKLDSSQWPAETGDYEILIDQTGAGSVQVYDKETGGEQESLPVRIKVKDLKNDKTFWVEGEAASQKWRDVRIDLGLDRPEGGLDKLEKHNGDWARFTVVEIAEVKIDYTPQANQATAWDSAQQRFYINFRADNASHDGRKVTLAARLNPKLEGVPIYFMLALDKNNGKKANWGVDLPSKWKWKDISADLKSADKQNRVNFLHLSEKTDANGDAKKELVLSRFAGDVFQPACYLEQDPHLAKYVVGHADLAKRKPVQAPESVTVWRQFWYQIVKVEGMNPPALDGAAGQYQLVKAEMTVCPELPVTRVTVDGFNPKAIYPRYMVLINGGNADALVVSDTNKNQFFSGYVADATKPVTIPILICDAQWDPDGNSGSLDFDAKAAEFPVDMDTDKLALSPPLQGGNLLVQGDWKAAEWDKTTKAWTNVRAGHLANGDLSINASRASLNAVTVALPAGVGATTAQTHVWIKNLIIRGAKGPYLGEYSSATKRILAVYDPTEAADFQNTIAHEIGHSLNQVTQAPPGGIPNHPYQYYKDGSHCKYRTNKCVMYESGPIAGSFNRYCDVCHPYLLVQDMSALK